MKVIIFGTGQYWNNRKKYILDTCDIVCFLDNNLEKCGKKFCGVLIDHPENILNYEFDYMVIMCQSQEDVHNQIVGLGVPEQKITTYDEFKQIGLKEYYVKYGKKSDICYDVVVISTALDYNGGTIAGAYAVKALQSRGKHVLLCAENCNEKMLYELRKDNIEVLIVPSLPFAINKMLMQYIKTCELVLVNVFQMLPLACQLNGLKPVLWWIHEPTYVYNIIMREFPQCVDISLTSLINCIAVSRISQKNFENKYKRKISNIMAYGIPDVELTREEHKKNTKVTFAIIGSITEGKAQDIFIKAIGLLSDAELENSEFYIIGSYKRDNFAEMIIDQAQEYNSIIITGNLTRAELKSIYPQIDIVVCPSREDSLPIVMTEAMMYRKPCIASDGTGTADYINNGINGFICKTEDAKDLSEKMRYFINHREKIENMGQEARKVYEEYFTMDKFANRLCNEMKETIDTFNKKKTEELCH